MEKATTNSVTFPSTELSDVSTEVRQDRVQKMLADGLLTFSMLGDTAAGVEEITRNYERHARSARRLAEEFVDSDKVLTRLLSELDVT